VKLFSVIQYLKYFLFSSHKKGHGIHSPFVFNLVLKVFRNKISPDIVSKLETIRRKLISDRKSIEVNDLGAGSGMGKRNFKRVSDIALYSSVPKRYGKLLAGLSSEFGGSTILEFGTSFGISTMYMAAANPGAVVYTIEGSGEVAEIAKENFAEAGLTNIKLFTGSFNNIIPRFEENKITPGLVFIDGNHRKEPTIEYFNRICGFSDEKSVIVIDDINHSREMAEAWKEIKSNKRVSVTVDICRMGIVFFREGITRSDYIIRY
jgi:predicted O-methyltransferase YrrM